jgi:DNA-binding NtrC family response regulator
VKLLRVLEARTITPVGGNKEIKVDTRVLAATSRDIREMMTRNQFREDLYYRLNVITIDLPPLRQRLDDIPLLVKRFMDRVNEQNGTKITSISPSVIDSLQGYSWPGNVRELLNIIERTMVLADKSTLEVDDLPAYIRSPGARTTVAAGSPTAAPAEGAAPAATGGAGATTTAAPAASAAPATLEQALATLTLADLEEKAIAAALVRYNNTRTRAARALGISVRTLQRQLGAKNGGEEAGDEGAAGPEAAPAPSMASSSTES